MSSQQPNVNGTGSSAAFASRGDSGGLFAESEVMSALLAQNWWAVALRGVLATRANAFLRARDDHLEPGAREAQLHEREDVLVVVRHEQHGNAVGDRVGEQQGVQHHLSYRRIAPGIQVVVPPPNEGCSGLEAVHRARRRQLPDRR